MVAAGVAVHARRPAELAPHDDAGVFQATGLCQVTDQGAQADVQCRQLLAQGNKVFAMRIPAAPTQGHESGACLHNTAGGAEALHVAIPGGHLIFGQPPRVFLLEIQGIEQAVAGDDAEGLFVEFIEADHLLAIIHVAPELIEAVE